MRAHFVNENVGGHATLHHAVRAALATGNDDVQATFFDVPAPSLPRRLVAQSAWAAASLRDDYGVPADRITVIPFGITVPDVAPREPNDDGDLPRLTFIGRSMDRKGGWRLLDLWRRHLRDRSRLTLVT